MKCLNCGTENAANAKFCIECGHRLNVQNKCPACGTIITGGKFCPECGTRLNVEPPLTDSGKSAEGSEPNVLKDDLFSDSIAGLAAAKKAENKRYADRKNSLKTARTYIEDGNYSEAKKIYDKLIEEDPTDMDAYMGLIRIATKNYTEYEGEEIDKSIRVAKGISDTYELGKYDYDYARYINRRDKYMEEKRPGPEEELDPFLLFLLGVGYTMGTDEEPVDNEKAVFYYRKAADRGSQQAMCALGACYQEGCGVEKSLTEAVKWYKKAAANGSNVAKDKLKELGY